MKGEVSAGPRRILDDEFAAVRPDLLGQMPTGAQIDTRRCHKAIIERQAIPILPTWKNGCLCKDDRGAARARNETLSATRYYGRAFWKRGAGYHTRSRIEAKAYLIVVSARFCLLLDLRDVPP